MNIHGALTPGQRPLQSFWGHYPSFRHEALITTGAHVLGGKFSSLVCGVDVCIGEICKRTPGIFLLKYGYRANSEGDSLFRCRADLEWLAMLGTAMSQASMSVYCR